jgi:ankyrin repeat protein
MIYDLCDSHMCYILQYGNTALHNAANNGHLEIVTLLISNGCDMNAKTTDMVSYI